MIEFKKWPKIPRWGTENEKFLITEKIDGTNSCVVIDSEGNIGAQSRNRLLSLDNDNFGFAEWVETHKDSLLQLGPGHHFGEWWGKGIQREYGLLERRFSLFNPFTKKVPKCCHVVPIVADTLEAALQRLRGGSVALPGYPRPEGLIVKSYLTGYTQKYIIDK